MSKPDTGTPIEDLLSVMARLRDPKTGCPWDIEQDFHTIAPHTVEEAYEVADAITRMDMDDLKEELGDLLLQVVFHAQIAHERALFSFEDVTQALVEKLIRRHPHVFGNDHAKSADDVTEIWNREKDREKKSRSAIDGVTLGLPALLRAQKLQKKAAKAGFEWPHKEAAWHKLEEELAEFKAAQTPEEKAEELGDVIFCIVNYARMSGFDAEDILAKTNRKFEYRFQKMERSLQEDPTPLSQLSLDVKLKAWNKAKKSS